MAIDLNKLAQFKTGIATKAVKSGTKDISVKDPTLFEKIIDNLSRFNYASAGAAKALVKGENPLKEAWKGFTLKEKETYTDVLRATGWKPTSTGGKIARGVAGFVGDVLLDPTTYLGIGALTKVGKVAKTTGQAGLTIAEQAAKGERALLTFGGRSLVGGGKVMSKIADAANYIREGNKWTTPVIQEIGARFVPKFRKAGVTPEMHKKTVDAIATFTNAAKYGDSEAVRIGKLYQSKIDDMLKAGKITSNDVDNLLINFNKGIVHADLEEVYGAMKTATAKQGTARAASGKISAEGYDVTRIASTETKEYLKEQGQKMNFGSRAVTGKTGSDFSRKYWGLDDGVLDVTTGNVFSGGKLVRTVPERELKILKARDSSSLIEQSVKGISEKLDQSTAVLDELSKFKTLSEAQLARKATAIRELEGTQPLLDDLSKAKEDWQKLVGLEDLSEAEQKVMSEILSEFDNAQAGYKVYLEAAKGGGDDVIGVSSTFPDFLPEKFRSKKALDEITGVMISGPGKKSFLRTNKALDQVSDVKKLREAMNQVLSTSEKNLNKTQKEFLQIIDDEVLRRNPGIESLRALEKTELNKLRSDLIQARAVEKAQISKAMRVDPKLLASRMKNIQKKIARLSERKASKEAGLQALKMKTVSAPEINEAVGRQIFSTDLGKILGTTMSRTTKQEAANEFAQNIAEAGLMKDVAPDFYDYLPDEFIKANPALKELVFHPEQLNMINSIVKNLTSDETVGGFVKAFDTVQNAWKGTATFVNPSFHTRNFVSNVWNNYLGGINPATNAGLYGKTGKMTLTALAKGPDALDNANKVFKAGKEFLTEREVYDLARKQGLINTGWAGSDIAQKIEDQLTRPVWWQKANPFSRKSWLQRGGSFVGEAVEDSSKLTHFIAKLNDGYGVKEAAESVKKYLFDYSDLTDFERNVMKRIFPFYTWTRKNLPLQVQQLIQQPGKVATVQKVRQNIEKNVSGEKLDERFLPDYIKDSVPVFLGGDKDTTSYLRLSGYLPTAQLSDLMRPLEATKNLITPLAKTPLELSANYSTFFEKPIERFPGETKEKFGIRVSAKQEYILNQIRPLSEVEKLLGFKTYDQTSGMMRLRNWLIGKTDSLNTDQAKRSYEFHRRDLLGKVSTAIEYAKKDGDKKEMERLKAVKKELEKHAVKIKKKKKN